MKPLVVRAVGRPLLTSILLVLTLALLVPLAAIAVTTFDRTAYRFSSPSDVRGPITLLVLGDSLGSGFRASPGASFVARLGADLRRARPGSRTYNLSTPGSKIGDLQRQLVKAPVEKADAVMLVAGGNDVRALTDPLKLALQERALLDRIHARFPDAVVFVANVPDVSRSMFGLPATRKRFKLWSGLRSPIRSIVALDDALVERMARNRNAAILDLLSLSRLPDADDPRFISSDGLHPNDAGHARIAAYAWPIVAGALGIAASGASPVDGRLLDVLREGETVILFRPALTDAGRDAPGPRGQDFRDCKTQRNLSEAGRRQAREIGVAFRAQQIPLGEIYTSNYCRAIETARLAFGRGKPVTELTARPGEEERVDTWVRKMLIAPLHGHKNRVLICEPSELKLLAGETIPEGEGAIFVAAGPDASLIARITPDQWAGLATR